MYITFDRNYKPQTCVLTYDNYRRWDYGKVLRECDNPIAGELFFRDHVGRDQEVLCHNEDKAAKQEETMHLSLKQTNKKNGYIELVLYLGKYEVTAQKHLRMSTFLKLVTGSKY